MVKFFSLAHRIFLSHYSIMGYRNDKPGVFLDRDGTIIEDTGFVSSVGQVVPIEAAFEAIRLLNEHGFSVVVVSNQSGVARGYFDEKTVAEINEYIGKIFARRGAVIDKFYFCPHYAGGSVEKYAVDCPCRKPNTGMIERAKRELGVRPALVIGDRESDILLGKNIGVPAVLVLTGIGAQQDEKTKSLADYVASDILDGVKWFLKRLER